MITIKVVFRADVPRLQDYVYLLQEEGFRIAGMLEDVIEKKDGQLFHIVDLQRAV